LLGLIPEETERGVWG
jgi:hypothetical protein